MDRITKERRSWNMSKIRSKNTFPERLLFKLLKKSGYKFKKHSSLPGKPDVVFTDVKLAVFIDGEFWHGRNFNQWENKLSIFWLKKISGNISRDRKTARLLRKKGWKIIRIWDKKLLKSPENAILRICRAIKKIQTKDTALFTFV